MKPTQRRGVVAYLQSAHALSQRRACRLDLSRKAQTIGLSADPTEGARRAIPTIGYLMMHALLKREGLVVNRKRTYRLYSELGMQVRTKRRKKLMRPRVPMVVPTRVNERWSLDFVHDQLADGRRIRILNIVDDFSRKCGGLGSRQTNRFGPAAPRKAS